MNEGLLDDKTSRIILNATVGMLAQYMSQKKNREKVSFRVPTANGPVLITAEKEVSK